MAVPGLNRDLVAVEQSMGGVVEMRVAESDRRSEGGNRIEGLHRIENRRVREPGNVSDRTERTAAKQMCAGHTTPQRSSAATGGKAESRDAAKGANGEGTVGQVGKGIAQRDLTSSPARHRLQPGGLQLLYLIRTAVERSAAEVLEKEITLGPELLESKSPEKASNRSQSGPADLVAPIRIRRFAHLQSWRDEASGGGMQIESGFVQAGYRRVLRVQHRSVLAESGCRCRSGLGLRRGTRLGGRADA